MASDNIYTAKDNTGQISAWLEDISLALAGL